MTFESFLASRLESRLRQPRVLVAHDPDGRFRDIILGLADELTTVLDCGGELLEAREAALDALALLGEDATCKRRLVLYLPVGRALDDADLCADPFAAFERAGAVFPDGAGDDYRQLCLQFLPEQAGKIEELFATGEDPRISVVNSLRSGAVDSAILREILKAEGPKDMLVRFLCAGDALVKELKAATHWVKDLKDLVSRTLGLKLEGPKETVEDMRSQLWRHLLFSEFACDLPGELPPALATVPRAKKHHESFVRSVCDTLRDLTSTQPAYEEAALRVAVELNLEAVCHDVEDFGELDTFSFEERGFLRRFASQLEAGRFEVARDIVARRQGSFWVQRDASRSAEWQLADLAARLVLEIQLLAGELPRKRDLDGWIQFYTGGFAKVDSIHRSMEQVAAEITPVEAPLAGVLARARETYGQACDSLARQFQTAASASGWPSTVMPRSVDVFDRWVEPRWKSGERVAFFWIDALRYELAMALELALAERHGTKLEVVCSSLPSITPVGMAALLPGASSALEVAEQDGKPVAFLKGKPVVGPKGRSEVLAAHVGPNRTLTVDLEAVATGKLPDDLDAVEVLAVKTIEIDSMGENNPAFIIRSIPDILRKIRLAVNRLADAGFHRAVLATDHGFAWTQSTSAGNAIAKPPGEWPVAKDRALLGSGTGDDQSMVMETAFAGIRTKIPHLALPLGMATYTAGVTYFHGGLSPQECILPVLDVQLKPAEKQPAAPRVDVTLTYRGQKEGTVTTLIPSVEMAYPAGDLFGPANVRVVLQALDREGKVVGEAASGAAVDPASREINLARGGAVKVPLRLKEGFEGGFKVVAADPATGATYASIKLATDFHH